SKKPTRPRPPARSPARTGRPAAAARKAAVRRTLRPTFLQPPVARVHLTPPAIAIFLRIQPASLRLKEPMRWCRAKTYAGIALALSAPSYRAPAYHLIGGSAWVWGIRRSSIG